MWRGGSTGRRRDDGGRGMARGVRTQIVAACLAGGLALLARGDEPTSPGGREIPPALAPFEYLVGSWKGAARPAANPIRGWTETHAWAWTFERGVPSGLSVTFEPAKLLKSARLTFDPASKTYTLLGPGPDGKAL